MKLAKRVGLVTTRAIGRETCQNLMMNVIKFFICGTGRFGIGFVGGSIDTLLRDLICICGMERMKSEVPWLHAQGVELVTSADGLIGRSERSGYVRLGT